MIINKSKFLELLYSLVKSDDIKKIKENVISIKENLKSFKDDKMGVLNITENGDTIKISSQYLFESLEQIYEAHTLERTKYYLNRFIKSLTERRTSKINDINLNRWKEYNDIITDSLWILKKRDSSGAHSAEYWGNFIPQIPNQFIRRYTKKGEWVLDTFLGSGTTLIECKRLGRNGIGIELQENVAQMAKQKIEKENSLFTQKVRTEVIIGDSTTIDIEQYLHKVGINSVQLIIMHPPYWDIIKFSNDPRDLSNAESIDKFLESFGKVIDNTTKVLDKDRYLVLVIGDKYSKGEWIPLGFYSMQEVLKRNFKLKSIIVKNFEETKGKMNQKELWRYRALVGGFYIFKHEYIFLFKKTG